MIGKEGNRVGVKAQSSLPAAAGSSRETPPRGVYRRGGGRRFGASRVTVEMALHRHISTTLPPRDAFISARTPACMPLISAHDVDWRYLLLLRDLGSRREGFPGSARGLAAQVARTGDGAAAQWWLRCIAASMAKWAAREPSVTGADKARTSGGRTREGRRRVRAFRWRDGYPPRRAPRVLARAAERSMASLSL
jgi:hypothetical protein